MWLDPILTYSVYPFLFISKLVVSSNLNFDDSDIYFLIFTILFSQLGFFLLAPKESLNTTSSPPTSSRTNFLLLAVIFLKVLAAKLFSNVNLHYLCSCFQKFFSFYLDVSAWSSCVCMCCYGIFCFIFQP